MDITQMMLQLDLHTWILQCCWVRVKQCTWETSWSWHTKFRQRWAPFSLWNQFRWLSHDQRSKVSRRNSWHSITKTSPLVQEGRVTPSIQLIVWSWKYITYWMFSEMRSVALHAIADHRSMRTSCLGFMRSVVSETRVVSQQTMSENNRFSIFWSLISI